MSKSKIVFNNLLSNENAERDTSFDALNYALSEKRIRNIGITGNYGSGKSSFIDTYINDKSDDFKFLRISLASFSNEFCKSQKNSIQQSITNSDDEHEQNFENVQSNETSYEHNSISNEDDFQSIEQLKKLDAKELKNIEISILQQMLYKKSAEGLPNSRFSRIRKTNRETVISFVGKIILFLGLLLLFIFPDYLFEQITILKFDFTKPLQLL